MRKNIWSASLLRKEFSTENITRARLYICGLGYYRAYLNGEMVGDRVLAPSDSDFSANAYYNVFDITDRIDKRSENCLGIELATGRWSSSPGDHPQQYYNRPVVIARLELTNRNGKIKTIVTDTSWQAGEHGILRSSFWIGELFDANFYPLGWDSPGFTGKGWRPAKPAGRYPQGELLRDPLPPERIVEYCDPVEVSEPLPGIYVYDFGKQITGRVKMQLDHLTKGQEIVLRYAEIKTGDAPKPVPTALAWYPDFNNDRQLPGMLQFKRRGSVASSYPLSYGGKDGRTKGNLGSYEIGGGHLYTDIKGSGEHQAETSLAIYPKEKRTRDEVISRPFFKAAWIMYAGHKSAALLTEMGHAAEAAKINRYLTVFNERFLNDPKLKLSDPKIGLWDPGAFARMGSDNLTLLGDLQPRKPDAELIKSIAAEMKDLGYMTIGVKSVYNLLSTVTQGGYADTAAAVLQRQEYPSLLYSVAHTGNTVAEGWTQQDSYAQIEGLASVGRWFYCDLVGIKPSVAQPAF